MNQLHITKVDITLTTTPDYARFHHLTSYPIMSLRSSPLHQERCTPHPSMASNQVSISTTHLERTAHEPREPVCLPLVCAACDICIYIHIYIRTFVYT